MHTERTLKVTARSAIHVMGMLLMLHLLWGCDYARMKEDEALRTYETQLPEMPERTAPVASYSQISRHMDPKLVENPLPMGLEVVDMGKERYGYYCMQCHGPRADGRGTVGQSFAPLPEDLKSSQVQGQGDGELFHKISFGYKRHPPLAYTVAEEHRWAIIRYLRSLAGQPRG